MARLFTSRLLWSVAALWSVLNFAHSRTFEWSSIPTLPDFSHAGYERGEQPLPNLEPDLWVTDFGAKPDTDSTAAFLEAIEAGSGKCIGIPEGRFILSDQLEINRSGTVLKGMGSEKTILHFTRGLEEIDPTSATTGGGEPTTQWSWSGGLISLGYSSIHNLGKTAVSAPARRGDTTIQVRDSGLFKVGDPVQISVRDDSEGTYTTWLYRGDPGKIHSIRGKTRGTQVVRVTSLNGNRMEIDRPLRFDLRPEWKPEAAVFSPKTHHLGVEGVTIDFPSRPYQGHFKEDGLNGIMIKGTHCWARDIVIRNSDSGIYLYGQFNTATDVRLESTRTPDRTGTTGHHGLTALGDDCLISNFHIGTRFIHDLTVDGAAQGNVFSNGSGVDLCFDHHRYAPYENLFTAIHLGEGTRPWKSGGAGGKGRHTAAGATFWNISSDHPFPLPDPDYGPGMIFVGVNTDESDSSPLPEGWEHDPIRPEELQPANLHEAQLSQRPGTGR